MNRLFIIGAVILVIAGCSGSSNAVVTGTCESTGHDYIYLNMIDVFKPVFIDSARINRKGNFRFSFKTKDNPNFYSLSFDEKEFITLIIKPADHLELSFHGSSLQHNYEVSGSPESEKIRILDIKLNNTIVLLDSLRNKYNDIVGRGDLESDGPTLEEEYSRIVDEQRNHNIAFILDNLTSFASIKALYQQFDNNTYVLYRPRDVQFLKLITDSLSRYYPDSKQVKALASNLEKELNGLYLDQLSSVVDQLEPTELEANLLNIEGGRVRLSSLRGKYYVLLAFWSPQSDECISNNLQMKEYYRLYHRKGFEIYQVDVGDDEDSWRASVKFDELPWINVREDDASYPETAILFNVSKVPANYLLDLQGEIIGKNLSGRNLQIKLSQLFD